MNVNPNRSFSMTSFNLGGGTEDYELLLASFHNVIKDFLVAKWVGATSDKPENIPEDLATNRVDFYLISSPVKK